MVPVLKQILLVSHHGAAPILLPGCSLQPDALRSLHPDAQAGLLRSQGEVTARGRKGTGRSRVLNVTQTSARFGKPVPLHRVQIPALLRSLFSLSVENNHFCVFGPSSFPAFWRWR